VLLFQLSLTRRFLTHRRDHCTTSFGCQWDSELSSKLLSSFGSIRCRPRLWSASTGCIQLRLGWQQECYLCRVAGNTVIPHGMWVPISARLGCIILVNCYTVFILLCFTLAELDRSLLWTMLCMELSFAVQLSRWCLIRANIPALVIRHYICNMKGTLCAVFPLQCSYCCSLKTLCMVMWSKVEPCLCTYCYVYFYRYTLSAK